MALMMLCMDHGWEGRFADAIMTAFRNFPVCDWLLATLPCDEQPPDALELFDCIAPLPWSPFPHKLFLLHRCDPYVGMIELHLMRVLAPT